MRFLNIGATIVLLALGSQAEAQSEREQRFGKDLAFGTGQKLKSVKPVKWHARPKDRLLGQTQSGQTQSEHPPLAKGVRVELGDGRVVERVRFKTGKAAAEYVAHHADTQSSQPRIVEVRGKQVVVITGSPIADPQVAYKTRESVWKSPSLPIPGGKFDPRDGFHVLAAYGPNDSQAFVLKEGRGPIHDSLRKAFDKGKQATERQRNPQPGHTAPRANAPQFDWWSPNAFRVTFDSGLESEIVIDPQGGGFSLAKNQFELEEIKTYVQGLMGAGLRFPGEIVPLGWAPGTWTLGKKHPDDRAPKAGEARCSHCKRVGDAEQLERSKGLCVVCMQPERGRSRPLGSRLFPAKPANAIGARGALQALGE